jgi:hypothetical protein
MTLSLVFIIFGILILIGAYTITIPHYFVLTFFASNFIILVSGAVLVGYSIQVVQRLRGKQVSKEPKEVNTP